MKKVLISTAVAAVIAVPAVVGLWGNASFSQAVPVRVPASGQVVAPSPTPTSSPTLTDDNGGDTPRDQRSEPGDDRDVQSGTPTPSPSTAGTDDNGGDTPRDQRTEPGDDRDVSGSSGSGSGSRSSSDGPDSSDDSRGSGHGGHGSDD